MAETKIEWADATWNPTTGCSPISEGCDHCYAKRMANRLRGRYGYPADDPFGVTFHPERLDDPLKWKKPRRIFVCSMADLFHAGVDVLWIDAVMQKIIECRNHIFMLLTKRPERMIEYMQKFPWGNPSENLWAGVTAENQRRADERIPKLLQIPAVVRFVSLEPLLGPVDTNAYVWPCCISSRKVHNAEHDGGLWCIERSIDWVICGGETGPGARPAKAEWFLDIIEQCKAAGVPVFVKKAPAGVPIIREFPTV